MSTPTCASCRFFGTRAGVEVWDDDFDLGDGYGPGEMRETDHHYCARIIHGNGHGNRFHTVSTEPAVVTDGSGYAARLRVLASFGCLLHEAATPTPDPASGRRDG